MKLEDLHQKSIAARTARKGLHEALQKYQGREAELQARYGSVSEGMAKNKLLVSCLPPTLMNCSHLAADPGGQAEFT